MKVIIRDTTLLGVISLDHSYLLFLGFHCLRELSLSPSSPRAEFPSRGTFTLRSRRCLINTFGTSSTIFEKNRNVILRRGLGREFSKLERNSINHLESLEEKEEVKITLKHGRPLPYI